MKKKAKKKPKKKVKKDQYLDQVQGKYCFAVHESLPDGFCRRKPGHKGDHVQQGIKFPDTEAIRTFMNQ